MWISSMIMWLCKSSLRAYKDVRVCRGVGVHALCSILIFCDPHLIIGQASAAMGPALKMT